jgi:putative oxidoreductase
MTHVTATPDTAPRPAAAAERGPFAPVVRGARWLAGRLSALPHSPIALLGRFSVAAVFWNSGQTKIEGLAINLVNGTFELGMPRLAPSAVDLFRDEYRLPLLAPELGALLAAVGELVLPLLLLLGLGTRLAALGLLAMTAVIQFLVYPGAYATHGVWAAVLLWLMARGPGVVSVDHLLAARLARR